jgi:prepilin signal peptidase PulO-like enzyme (type II secretory pathway)
MAIRIPILTSFDPKGLKQANAQFAKLQGSIGSLGKNFAIAGAAIAGVGVVLGKTVQTASNYAESVNAVNVAFGKSAQGIIEFGKTAATTLGVSQVDFNNAAVRFSAFADRIVGSGGDASKFIAEISTRASDFASVFNIEVSEALQVFQSGLAGEAEPLKRFGINLLDSEVKAYAMANGIGEVGRQLTETEKVQARYGLLMQATSKTSGDFANTSDGLANQLRILQAEVSNTEIEIGNQLLPVMAELLPVVRDLVRDLGTQLVTAVKAVDWQALATGVMNFTKFLVENATTIANVVIAIFTLNTAFKTMQVLIGITNVAIALKTWYLAQLASGMTLTTIATTLLSNALKLIPFVAITTAIVTVGIELANTAQKFGQFKTQIDNAKTSLNDFQVASAATGGALLDLDLKGFAPVLKIVQDLIKGILTLTGALNGIPKNVDTKVTVTTDYIDAGVRSGSMKLNDAGFIPALKQSTIDGGGGAKQPSFAQTLKKQVTLSKKTGKLVGAGLSEGLAQAITSSNKPVQTANKILQRIQKNGAKAVNRLQGQFNKTAAGQAELTSISQAQEAASAAASQAAEQAAQEAASQAAELQRAQEEQARQEQAILDERARIYNSFLDSVKNTFAGIKDSILGAFDLTQLGGSTNAITRNMEKLLVKVRSFASNVSKLSSMGLDPSLLQQVIAAGPLAGARLAQTLVAGGANALGSINAGFAEIGSLSSMIAQTGTESRFGSEAQQNIYNISVDGGVGSGATIGKSIVDAIKAYERTSGAVWQGA